MHTLTSRSSWILAAALGLGLLADFLLQSGPPGLGFALWILTFAGISLFLHLGRRREALSEVGGLLLLAGAFGAALAWRDAESLKILGIGAAAAAFALAAFRGGVPWLGGASLFTHAIAIPAAIANSVIGAALLLLGVDRRQSGVEGPDGAGWRRALPVLKGAFLALPFLFLVGALFAAADETFAELLRGILRFDPERFLLIAFFAWITAGYLRRLLGAGPGPQDLANLVPWRPSLGFIETATALLLMEALFLAFILVQLRTYFGGVALIEATPGLGYAEYARQGFFELVFVAAITLPLLLGADHLLRRESPRDERGFRMIAWGLVVLLGVVMASAFHRLGLYLDTFGLTEDRFYAGALLAFFAAVLLWLAATILRGRRAPFAPGVLIGGFVGLALLFALNPAAIVLRVNLDRAQAGAELDAEHLSTLGADAVPLLLERWGELAEDARCTLAPGLLDEWGSEVSSRDWRSWSWSDARARAAVGAAATTLESASAGGGCEVGGSPL